MVAKQSTAGQYLRGRAILQFSLIKSRLGFTIKLFFMIITRGDKMLAVNPWVKKFIWLNIYPFIVPAITENKLINFIFKKNKNLNPSREFLK